MDDMPAPTAAVATHSTDLRRLSLKVIRGDITRVPSQAYVLGVFDNVNPTGAGKAVDSLLDGKLSQLVQDRMFGSRLGEIFILPTPRQQALCEMVVIVGLGPIDSFRPQIMELCAENLARVVTAARLNTLTTVPIGTNAGLSVESAIQCFADGFLRGLNRSDIEQEFKEIAVCEFDAGNHAKLVAELRRHIDDGYFKTRHFDVHMRCVDAPAAPAQVAASRSGEVEKPVDPLYLQVSWSKDAATQYDRYDYTVLTADLGAAIKRYEYVVTPESGHAAGHQLAVAKQIDAELGQVLANYYVAQPVREVIERHLEDNPDRHVVVIHDRGSSHIPWEVLHFGKHCPAIGAGMSRKFVTPATRAGGRSNLPKKAMVKMLVIANPTEDLPGAEEEGKMLKALFADKHGDVRMLARKDATEANILNEIGSNDYDIVHYAGHAEFVGDNPEDSGLLCADGRLTSADFTRAVLAPQIVFLNGCESGRVRTRKAAGGPQELSKELYTELGRNVSLAELILTNGVTNFIGTYWPVNDQAAFRFSQVFYEHMLTGAQLGRALREARHAIHDINKRDWANYIHFGSPVYRLRRA